MLLQRGNGGLLPLPVGSLGKAYLCATPLIVHEHMELCRLTILDKCKIKGGVKETEQHNHSHRQPWHLVCRLEAGLEISCYFHLHWHSSVIVSWAAAAPRSPTKSYGFRLVKIKEAAVPNVGRELRIRLKGRGLLLVCALLVLFLYSCWTRKDNRRGLQRQKRTPTGSLWGGPSALKDDQGSSHRALKHDPSAEAW